MKKNTLKYTMIFMSVAFVMLILPIKVYAYGLETTPIENGQTSQYYNDFYNFILNGSTNLSYGAGTYNYINDTFIPNKVYENKGQYYFCFAMTATAHGDCYATDYQEQFYLSRPDIMLIKYDSSKPVFHYHLNNGTITSSEYISSNVDYGFTSASSCNPIYCKNYIRTNFTNPLKYSNSSYNTFKTSDNIKINKDDVMVYFDNGVLKFNSINYTSKPKAFDEIIDTSIYSSVEFNFDTSNVADFVQRGNFTDVININYSFSSIDLNGDLIDKPFDIPYFYYYGKDIYSDGSVVNSWMTSPFNHYIQNKYEDNMSITATYFDSNLKLVVPFDLLNDGLVHLNFSSNLGFTVNYISRNTVTDYYSSVDITGKYGVAFKPNQTVNSFQSIFKFSDSGQYTVQVRDNFSVTNDDYNIISAYSVGYCIDDIDYTGLVPISCSDYYYLSIPSYFLEKKQIVYVQNKKDFDKSINSIVYYDSRYYTPYVQDTSYSSVNIIDNETNEVYVLGPMDNFNEKYNQSSNASFVSSFTNAFNNFKNDIISILKNITTFWESLTIKLQYFYIIIFVLGMIAFLIRFIL